MTQAVPAAECTVVCGVCMRNTGQTSSPSGGHSNIYVLDDAFPTTPAKIVTSHLTHAHFLLPSSTVFFSVVFTIF